MPKKQSCGYYDKGPSLVIECQDGMQAVNFFGGIPEKTERYCDKCQPGEHLMQWYENTLETEQILYPDKKESDKVIRSTHPEFWEMLVAETFKTNPEECLEAIKKIGILVFEIRQDNVEIQWPWYIEDLSAHDNMQIQKSINPKSHP